MSTKTKTVEIDLSDVQVAEVSMLVRIQGLPPGLLLRNFDATSRAQIEHGANKSGKPKNQVVDPRKEAESRLYLDRSGRPAIPSRNIKMSLVTAIGRFMQGRKGMVARSTIYITGMDEPDSCLIVGGDWVVDERIARTSGIGRTPYVCRRPLFPKWETEFKISWPENQFDPKYIVQALVWSGKNVGLCEYRPEKSGDFGRFLITSAEGV